MNHNSTTTRPPTAARPAEHQQRRPPYYGAPPTTTDSFIPRYPGRGTRICRAPGPTMPQSPGVGTASASPPFLPHILPYGRATMMTTSPPSFSTYGNPLVRLVPPSDAVVAVDPSSTPTRRLLSMLLAEFPPPLHRDHLLGRILF